MDTDIPPELQEVDRLVDEALTKLGEHCDSVQIFCTITGSDGDGTTRSIERGAGNWYARYGQVVDWLVAKREETRNSTRDESDD
jgi:hypothetical protein